MTSKNQRQIDWAQKNKEKIKSKNKKYRKKAKKEYPWMFVLYGIRSRCVNKKRSYYKRGILNFLSEKDIEYLWKRDVTRHMRIPSIDRIDNKGHYTLKNCRFIPMKEHVLKDKYRGMFGKKKNPKSNKENQFYEYNRAVRKEWKKK